jgi:hypothetical protein
MTKLHSLFSLRIAPALCGIALTGFVLVPLARAGGPLFIGPDGSAVKWSATEVRGGPLNTQTVGINGSGVRQIFYRVDSGPLGSLTHEQAAKLVDRIFGEYSAVQTADIDFVNAGPILDPSTGNPIDVTGTNAGLFLSGSNPPFQNPIIFDSDGSITGRGGVLGFFSFLQIGITPTSAALREGTVVLNGSALSRGLLSPTAFLGVFTHEFGHFAGPLDHEQINGNLALSGDGAAEPVGFSAAQSYDLFAPFTETLFPFLFNAPSGSQFTTGFDNSGFFIATIDLDTQNSLSNLYPTPDYQNSRGAIEGRVLVRAGVEIPITGVNVVARRIDQASFPPAADVKAFPTSPVTVDEDGVPVIPPEQVATDSLATVSSAVTGLDFGEGTYRIQGLPPGNYLVGIQQINPDAVGGSGIGPLNNQINLPFAEEYYNGATSSNSATTFVPVTVTAGAVTTGIDIILNGISSATPANVTETEPNQKMNKGQKVSFPVMVTGVAAMGDEAKLKMKFPDGSVDPVEDLYTIKVDRARTVFILLEPISGSGDLDLYLFDSGASKKKSSIDDPHLLALSAGATARELISFSLEAGTYNIGISAFDGSVNYRLTIITSD